MALVSTASHNHRARAGVGPQCENDTFVCSAELQVWHSKTQTGLFVYRHTHTPGPTRNKRLRFDTNVASSQKQKWQQCTCIKLHRISQVQLIRWQDSVYATRWKSVRYNRPHWCRDWFGSRKQRLMQQAVKMLQSLNMAVTYSHGHMSIQYYLRTWSCLSLPCTPAAQQLVIRPSRNISTVQWAPTNNSLHLEARRDEATASRNNELLHLFSGCQRFAGEELFRMS